jgi:signal transduction histidine kinase
VSARELSPVDRIAQYVLVYRMAVAGLALFGAQQMDRGWLVLSITLPLIVAANYLALRHWVFVLDELRIPAKPLYLVLDLSLALTMILLVGLGSPLVLYLVGTGVLGGLVYRGRTAMTATAATAAFYGLALWQHAGSAPGAMDIHTVVTLPALILLSGPAAAAVRRLLVDHDRGVRELGALREQMVVREERLRLARELHDSLTKNLHGIWLLSGTLRTAVDRHDQDTAHRVAELVGRTARQLTEQARSVIHDLRDDVSQPFADELAQGVHRVAEGHGLSVSVQVDPAVVAAEATGQLSPAVRRQVIAVVGEAVHNTVKHARARTVSVSASCDAGRLTVSVLDDGVGFCPDEAAQKVREGHFGLVGMKERAQHAGGRLTVDAAPGRGTRVEVCVACGPPVELPARGGTAGRDEWNEVQVGHG